MNFLGQAIADFYDNKMVSSNNDNSILACALQVQTTKTKRQVVILTNDKTLLVKAEISSLKTCLAEDILDYLESIEGATVQEDPLVSNVKETMEQLCSYVLEQRLNETYPDTWRNKIRSSPPWLLVDCLKYIKTFWGVLSQNPKECASWGLGKYCSKKVEDLMQFLEINEGLYFICT